MDPRAETTPPPRWLLIIGGVVWLFVGLVLLSLDATSAVTLGYGDLVAGSTYRSWHEPARPPAAGRARRRPRPRGAACARKYQAEQDGKDVGQALCDIRDADTPEDAKNAAEDLSKQISEDITVIRRSLQNVRHDLGDTGQATVDGAFEGMDDCIDG